MTQEEIHSILDKMLENPKSKTFINHLVRAYMPITNIQEVMDQPKGDFKCVITKDSLFSAQDIFEGIQTEEFKANFMNNLKSMFDEKADKTSPIAKLVGEKNMGVTGKDTTTFMSYLAFQEFYNWVITKSLKGDKHINWLLGSIKRSSFIERAENIQDVDVQNKIVNMKKKKPVTTFTLGDASDILSKLKKQMDSDGN